MLAITAGDTEYGTIPGDYNLHVNRLQTFITQLKESQGILVRIVKNVGKEDPSIEDLKQYHPRTDGEASVIGMVVDRMPLYPDFARLRFREVDHLLDLGEYHLRHGLNRTIASTADTLAGNRKREGVDAGIGTDPPGLVADPNVAPFHGTYVAGIIAAVRNNGVGIDGISDHTRIMMLKLSNNIREMRNTDLASAIYYSVDHGARIINMSFGKRFSFHRQVKDIIMRSVVKRNVLTGKCVSGGVVNAYDALKLAAGVARDR
jgi:subtilisin family serine protease